jgi:hypothetical protein
MAALQPDLRLPSSQLGLSLRMCVLSFEERAKPSLFAGVLIEINYAHVIQQLTYPICCHNENKIRATRAPFLLLGS